MQRVVTIELNGGAYQLDEAGYQALRAYLDQAAAQLAGNPDKVEIMADLEQAIAEKCSKFLHARKTVVSTTEIEQIITEMGPVETAAGAAGESDAPPRGKSAPNGDAAGPKRLYQIREGAMISGICNGLAAYFGIDVTLIRVIFVALAILSFGAWILAYIAMMFIIPYAHTSEEHAAAHGWAFSAQRLVEQAKRQHAHFTSGKEWRRNYRRQRREWRHRWRGPWWHAPGPQASWAEHAPPVHVPYAAQVLAGVMAPFFGIFSAVCLLAFIFALISLVTTGAILGWTLPTGIPLWAGVVALALVYNALIWPLRTAHRGSYHAASGPGYGWFAAWDGIFRLGLTCVLFWLAYRYVPQVHHFVHNLPAEWNDFIARTSHTK